MSKLDIIIMIITIFFIIVVAYSTKIYTATKLRIRTNTLSNDIYINEEKSAKKRNFSHSLIGIFFVMSFSASLSAVNNCETYERIQ